MYVVVIRTNNHTILLFGSGLGRVRGENQSAKRDWCTSISYSYYELIHSLRHSFLHVCSYETCMSTLFFCTLLLVNQTSFPNPMKVDNDAPTQAHHNTTHQKVRMYMLSPMNSWDMSSSLQACIIIASKFQAVRPGSACDHWCDLNLGSLERIFVMRKYTNILWLLWRKPAVRHFLFLLKPAVIIGMPMAAACPWQLTESCGC